MVQGSAIKREIVQSSSVRESGRGKRRRITPDEYKDDTEKNKEQTMILPPVNLHTNKCTELEVVLPDNMQRKLLVPTKTTVSASTVAPNRYVPTAPPTAQQIMDHLLSQSNGKINPAPPTFKFPSRATPPSCVSSPTAISTFSDNSSTSTETYANKTANATKGSYRRLESTGVTKLSSCTKVIVQLVGILVLSVVLILFGTSLLSISSFSGNSTHRLFPHIVPPSFVTQATPHQDFLTNMTLRNFLTSPEGFHLAMAPSFFGYYTYFGALSAWDDAMSMGNKTFFETYVTSVSGASAGAMAAVLLAAGIPPRQAAELCTSVQLLDFADPPGIGGAFKGDLFEQIMHDFMQKEMPESSLLLEDAIVPIAVTALDLKSLQGRILSRGSMARAARASATFPLLFQPVSWNEHNESYLLIDGGITDGLGLQGLSVLSPNKRSRIVNIVAGEFGFTRFAASAPSAMPAFASEVLYISIRNTPNSGPWAMQNGPRALEASFRSMRASLDLPLYKGKEEGHFELHIDATDFVPP